MAAAVIVAMALASTVAACGGSDSSASGDGGGDTVKIAGIWPLSGPFAQNGQASLDGATFAAEEINRAGGIEALDGAKIEIVEADTGASAQTAVSATRNVLDDDAVVAGIGSWLSSYTVATSEVAQRLGVPWVSESFGDEVTNRGYDYVFDIMTPISSLSGFMYDSMKQVSAELGRDVRRVAIVGDNTVAAVPAQEELRKLAEDDGVEVVFTDQWKPPLADAAGLVAQIASSNPDVIFEVGYSYDDEVQLNQQLRSRNIDALRFQLGGQSTLAAWRDVPKTAQGLIGVVGYAPDKGNQEVATALAKHIGVPFANQDQLSGYALVQVIAAALEASGSTDRAELRDAIAGLDVTSGQLAELVPGGTLRFDENGRIESKEGRALQWQDGRDGMAPCTVVPEAAAECTPR